MKMAYINGKIYTASKKNSFANCFIVENNKFSKVGIYEELKSEICKCDKIIDLNNSTILPGFIDSHVHFILGGFSLLEADLSEVRSKSEFINYIKNFIKSNNSLWITGGNWDHQYFDLQELPDKKWIDDLSTDIPIFLTRTDYHMGLANSKALEISGINKHTKNPDGGYIDKDKEGEPTGILRDRAIELLVSKIPFPTEESYIKAASEAFNYASSEGITGVYDMYLNKKGMAEEFYKKIEKPKCRINIAYPIENIEILKKSGINTLKDELVRKTAIKIFADGSLGSETAYFFEPYETNKNYTGLQMAEFANGSIKEIMLDADLHRIQLIVHAIGDRAVYEVIDIFEQIVKLNPAYDRRHRIEHAQHIRQTDIERIKKLGIIASIQPQHLFDDGSWLENKIGENRKQDAFRIKSLIDAGIRVCFGSDWTVAPMKPLSGIYSAVTRQTRNGEYPDGFNPDEKISVEQAINAYTIDAAYASFSEKYTGSIEEDKSADFIILDSDIFSVLPSEIRNIKVVKTYFRGELTFDRTV